MGLIKIGKRIALFPAHQTSKLIGKIYKHNPKRGRVIVGAIFVLLGAAMAHHRPEVAPEVLWDAMAWGLHGFGLTPIAGGFWD